MRILIADPQPALRSAVGLLLEQRLELEAVGEAADTQELWAQLEHLRPDILLLDRDLPDWSIGDLFNAFRGLDRQPKVIVLGMQPKPVRAAERAQASL